MTPQANVAAALVAAQAEFPTIDRTRTVRVKTKSGGTYSFDYAPLDTVLATVRPILTKHDLAVSQTFDLIDASGQPVLRTWLLHASGEAIMGVFPLRIDGMDAQQVGSLVTYMRRYAIIAILGLATEDDDDANRAGGSPSHAPETAETPSAGEPPAPQRRPTQAETSDLVAVVDELMAMDAITVEQLQRVSGIELPWPDMATALDADLTLDLLERLRPYLEEVKTTAERRAREAAEAEPAPDAEPAP